MKARAWYAVCILCPMLLLLAVGAAYASETSAGVPGSKPLPPPSDWLHYGYDSQFTSNNRLESTIDSGNVKSLILRWGLGCPWPGHQLSATPAIRGDFLYATASTSRLGAWNAQTGQSLWEFGENPSWRPPVTLAEDGTVFCFQQQHSSASQFFAVDGQTGQQLWEAPLGFDMGYNDSAVVTVDETKNRVYLVENGFSGDGKLYALDKDTGEVLWYKSKVTDDAEFFGDYVLLDDGKIYVPANVPQEGYPDHADYILRIDTTSLAIAPPYKRPEQEEYKYYDLKRYSLCDDKLIVTFDRTGSPELQELLVAYDVVSTTVLWQKSMPKVTGTIACNQEKHRIYVPTDPSLYALDADTGDQVWKYDGLAKIYNPSIANGIVYFLSNTNMYAIDEETHAQLFRYALGAEAYETTQVAVANGMLFFSGNNGTCEMFALGFPPPVRLPLVVKGVR